jgi:hypothetical protein
MKSKFLFNYSHTSETCLHQHQVACYDSHQSGYVYFENSSPPHEDEPSCLQLTEV